MKGHSSTLCWILCLAVMASVGGTQGSKPYNGESESSILAFQQQLDQMIAEAPNRTEADVRGLQHALAQTIHPDEDPGKADLPPELGAVLLLPQRFLLCTTSRRVIPAPRHTAGVDYRRQEQRPLRPPGTRCLYEFHLLSNAPPTLL